MLPQDRVPSAGEKDKNLPQTERPFRTCAAQSRGRLVAEPESAVRSVFQRDRDRIIHSSAFRRLEYKTQVLVNFEGDHFRTRLTHSLEVAQIARTLTRALGGNEDLAEAIALAHDLGHPPFGHTGEAELNSIFGAHGGFDHNIQAFRIVTKLEWRYARFDGLNLSAETLEGIIKHGGALKAAPAVMRDHPLLPQFGFGNFGGLEAQAAAIADDIAYCAHDLDDGVRGGFFTIDDLAEVPLAARMIAAVHAECGTLAPYRLQHEMVRRVIDFLVTDLVRQSQLNLNEHSAAGVTDLRSSSLPAVALSELAAGEMTQLREFLKCRMYRHYKVNRMALKARRIIRELAETLLAAPDCLPANWQERLAGGADLAPTVRDYIAGMTDRFAHDEHERLFDLRRLSL